jgi:hypothetical protein
MTDLYCSDCLHFSSGVCRKKIPKPVGIANSCRGFEFKPRHTLNWDY